MTVSYKPQLSYTDFKDLTEQIHFHSTEGKIWFGEQRMLLMNLTSLAAFRREIVNSLKRHSVVWWGGSGYSQRFGSAHLA